MMHLLSDKFKACLKGELSPEEAWDTVPQAMNRMQPDRFPYGPEFTSVDYIAEAMFTGDCHAIGKQQCPECGFIDPRERELLPSFLSAVLRDDVDVSSGVPISRWLEKLLSRGRSNCPLCSTNVRPRRMRMSPVLMKPPSVLMFYIDSKHLIFNEYISFGFRGSIVKMQLRGIIYGGGAHFTSRIVDRQSTLWFDDGMTTGRWCAKEKPMANLKSPLDLQTCKGKNAVAVLYVLCAA
jgi:hypothetical protein